MQQNQMNKPEEIRVLTLISYKFLPAKLGGQKNIALFFKFFSSLIPTTCVTVKDNDTSCVTEYEVLNIIQNGRLSVYESLLFFYFKKNNQVKKNNPLNGRASLLWMAGYFIKIIL